MKICAVQGMVAVMLCGVAMAHNNFAQVLDRKVTLTVEEIALEDALKKIESVSQVTFYYSLDQLDVDEVISFNAERMPLREVLDGILKPHGIKYKVQEKDAVILLKREFEETAIQSPSSEKNESSSPERNPRAAITGRVTDATTQQPMAGVNIIVKGTTRGTATDSDGRYSIEADQGDALVFSFIGYTPFEARIEGETVIDVVLEVDITKLKEVTINAGYYTTMKATQTGNIVKVSGEQIHKQPVSNPLAALQGRVAGLTVQQYSGMPGSNFAVQIRGRNSIANGNDPLYIVDGVPYPSGSLSHGNAAGGIYGSGGLSLLNNINPDNIESIEVLKDADATAIYGSRGANGVILITTKKATEGKMTTNVNVYSGISQMPGRIELLNTEEYLAMREEAIANDNYEEFIPDRPVYFADVTTWDANRETDWQEELLGGSAQFTNANLSLSGGTAYTQFYLTGSYQKQGTIFPGENSARRGSGHLNVIQTSLDKKFKISLSANYALNHNDLLSFDFTRIAITLPPNAPALYNADGKLNWEQSTWENPLSNLENRYQSHTRSLITSSVLEYEILPGLELRTSVGINEIQNQERSIGLSTSYDPALNYTPAISRVFYHNGTTGSWIIEPIITWEKKVGSGNLTMLAGSTFQNQNTEKNLQLFSGFSSNALVEDLNSASTVDQQTYSTSLYRYNAVYTRVNYDLNGKYILNITGRRDGSSRFGPNRRFANFGAAGAAWVFSNENFIKNNIGFLSFGKLRASYGTTGNDQIGDYMYLDSFSSLGPYQGVPGLYPTQLLNPDYAWETNRKLESALEIGVLENSIQFSISHFRNRSSNQLISYPLASTTGFSGITTNLDAVVENTGWEFEFSSVNIKNGYFTWTASGNLTMPRNELVSFPGLEKSSYFSQYEVGRPLNISKRYKFTGLDPQTGIFQFADLNEDGTLSSSDRLEVVEIGQEFYGGLSNSFQFKGFQLEVFFQFVKQNGAGFLSTFISTPGGNANQPKEVFERRWQTPGDPDATLQFFTINNSAVRTAYQRYAASDMAFGDASFVRLKNFSIAYQFPENLVKGLSCRLYFQAQNLLTFTNYGGLDPENNSSNVISPLRTLVSGVQFTF